MSNLNMPNRVEILKEKFTKSIGLPFQDLLPSSTIQEVLWELKVKYRQRLFDPFVTVWAFLSQVLDTDKSCHHAVSRVIAWLAAENLPLPSEDTSAYCQARSRLPEDFFSGLFNIVAEKLEKNTSIDQLWCGRHVKVIDGSTVSMPDTDSNQTAYPQHSNQRPKIGFPIAKIGALFSLTTGAALAVVIDVLNTHDLKLARKLYDVLSPDDVLLGDRAFCAYADIACLLNRCVDVVFRQHSSRKKADGRGQVCDRLVVWYKPKKCPQGISKQQLAGLPKHLILREVHYVIAIPGFRSQQVSLITTLLNSDDYPTLKLIELYEKRWDVEVNLKHLKTSLGMDILRGQTPGMVRKEIYVYLLAYNLLRSLMWESATTHGIEPLRLSLQGTRHHLDTFMTELASASAKKLLLLYQKLLEMIAHKPLLERPGRFEPRVRKRRPKSYPLMQQSREVLRLKLA